MTWLVWVTLMCCPCCPQLRQRFELEIERMKQMHQKDREDQEEELEDVRQSCQKRVSASWALASPVLGAIFLRVGGGAVHCRAWGPTFLYPPKTLAVKAARAEVPLLNMVLELPEASGTVKHNHPQISAQSPQFRVT